MIVIWIMVLKLSKCLIIFFLGFSGICSQKYFGAELRTKKSYKYGRYEATFKSARGEGLVSSFFTYHDEGGGNWNEIDIEVLGRWTEILNMNTITKGQSSHLRESFIKGFDPHANYHDYAFEWTPSYVAWFINGEELYRQSLPDHSYISTLNKPQKIMMNLWVPVYEDWVGKWDEAVLPRFAFYDRVAYYEYTPDAGNYGTNNNFKINWEDTFDTFDSTRWEKATHGFTGNRVKFEPENVVYEQGKMILCLTNNSEIGYQDVQPPTILYAYSINNNVTVRLSEELRIENLYNLSNYSLNNSYVTSINVDPDERTIYLSTNGLKENSSYWLSIVELEDKFGNKSEKIINIEKVQPVTVPFKVNVGGPKIGDFKKDQYWWKDSDSYGHLNGSLQNSEGIEINNTSNDIIYQTSSERIALYKVRLLPGIYDITLMFSENYYEENQRYFSIRIEGETIFSKLDIASEVGKNTAIKKTIPYVSVMDGILEIHFETDLYGVSYEAAGPFLNGLIIEHTNGLSVINENSPSSFKLSESYPNPFNGTTSINIIVNEPTNINIDILDINGRFIESLVKDQIISTNTIVHWNSKNYSSGVYIVRGFSGKQFYNRKITLLK